MCNLLLLCGDAELNPGPDQNTVKKISLFLFTVDDKDHPWFKKNSTKRKTKFIKAIEIVKKIITSILEETETSTRRSM